MVKAAKRSGRSIVMPPRQNRVEELPSFAALAACIAFCDFRGADAPNVNFADPDVL